MATEESNTQNQPNPTHRYSSYCFCCRLPITRSDITTTTSSLSSSSAWQHKWWWGKSVEILMKFREWSELIAGPRWKTFIRRFNRNRSGGVGRSNLNGPFNYDPLSYSLNFDEGHGGQSSQFEVLEPSRDFSSRYAAVPKTGT